MSKNKKNGSKGAVATVAAAVVAAMVRTMDGIEVAVEKALTLSREALIAFKRAAGENSPIAKMLSGIIATLDSKGPDAFVFDSTESPKAKALAAALQTVRTRSEVKLFVPLTEERAKRDAWLASKGEKTAAVAATAEKAVADAKAKIEAEAKAKGEARAKRRAEEEASAEVLDGFVDHTVVEERQAVHKNHQEAHQVREGRITPFSLGQAVVVLDKGRPSSLRATLADGSVYEVPVVTFVGLRNYGEEILPGINPADIPVTCGFCKRDMHLGDMLPPRKEGDRSFPAIQQVGFEARTPDGSRVWSYAQDQYGRDGQVRHHKGDPRPQSVLTCKGCASIARGIGPKVEVDDKDKPGVKKTVPAIRSYDLYRSYLEWTTNPPRHNTGQYDGNDDAVMATGPAPALKAPPRFDPAQMAAVAAAVGKSTKTE